MGSNAADREPVQYSEFLFAQSLVGEADDGVASNARRVKNVFRGLARAQIGGIQHDAGPRIAGHGAEPLAQRH